MVVILALCPSRGRPDKARECLASFEATRRDPASRLVFIVDDDDDTRGEYPGEVYVARAGGSYVPALNAAARDKALVRDATAIGFVGDDVAFRTPGWDVTLGTWLTENIGIAWGDDGWDHHWKKEDKASHWWVSRPIVDVFGLAPAGLHHFYPDDYWAQLGWAAACARYFSDVLIEHLHPMAGKADTDDTYSRSRRFVVSDKTWWARWQRRGKTEDVAKLRAILRRSEPRRVLADWHHPALWESLSILLEDRFGWELYSPIGIDWTRHGWTFEHTSIGWKAEDYLVFPDALPVGDHFERRELEYPERVRKLVTWEQAQSQRWDFVLASVAIHQRPFADLAKRFGARLIHQIGNATQPIDRHIPQIVLASAAIPRHTRNVVTYHQEFDRSLFAYSPPVNRSTVTATMLRLDTTSGPYQWLSEARGVKWTPVGGADPRAAGYLAPMSKVASRIRDAGWVWHDKKIGDGYGHALHNAAAMGRPLIGHASHYKGQLGAAFWRDLETCIDLDRHPPERALRLFKAISADPEWHNSIADELADTFSRTVDFDSEAAQIRAVLQ